MFTPTALSPSGLLPDTPLATAELLQRPLSFSEQCHVRYLQSVATRDPVSMPMASAGQAQWELEHSPELKQYLRDSATINLPVEIERFNEVRGYETCFFVDWLALRDYKEDGYTRLNPALRNANGGVEVHAAIDQLTYALKSVALFQLSDFETDVVYRGETRPSGDLAELQRGDVYTTSAFMSASGQADIASKFHKDRASLEAGEVNVLYEIERTTPLAGPMVSDLLRDHDEEVIFLPGTSSSSAGSNARRKQAKFD